jgi:UrcA family protein
MKIVKLMSVVAMGIIAFTFTSAANAATYRQVTVSIADIDLTTDLGRHEILRRLYAAAREVCPKSDPRDGTRFHSTYACERAAVQNAMRDLRAEYATVRP